MENQLNINQKSVKETLYFIKIKSRKQGGMKNIHIYIYIHQFHLQIIFFNPNQIQLQ